MNTEIFQIWNDLLVITNYENGLEWLNYMKFSLNNVTFIKYLYVLFCENLRVTLQHFSKDSKTLLSKCTVMHRMSRSAAFSICTSFSVCRSPNSPTWETPCFLQAEHCTLILALVTGRILLDHKFEHCVFCFWYSQPLTLPWRTI